MEEGKNNSEIKKGLSRQRARIFTCCSLEKTIIRIPTATWKESNQTKSMKALIPQNSTKLAIQKYPNKRAYGTIKLSS